MSQRKTLIQKLKSQNRRMKSTLKLYNPKTVKLYIENLKIFKKEIEKLSEEKKSLEKEVYFYKSKVEAFGKKGFFKKLWEVIRYGKQK